MRVGPDRYSLLDRALGYFALFLLGLIGCTCDRLPAQAAATGRLRAAQPPAPIARQH